MKGEQLSGDEKDFIREYVAEATTNAAKTERRNEMAAEFAVSLPTIRAITAWTKIREKKILEEVVRSPEIPSSETEDIDYDNKQKLETRTAYRNFISSHFSPDQLRNAKALCFCATDWLDVRDIFDPLGIPRNNVTGAEFDVNLQDKARSKGIELGTNFHAGDVRELLNNPENVFDIVILDFKGQMSQTSLDILRRVRPSGIVITNFQRKRERKDIQHALKENEAYSELRRSSLESPLGAPRKYAEMIPWANKMASASETELDQLAEEQMFYEIFNSLGTNIEERWLCRDEALRVIEVAHNLWGLDDTNADSLKRAMSFAQDLVADGFSELLERFGISKKDSIWGTHNIAPFTQRTVLRKGLLIDHQVHRYKSPRSNTPFISHMGLMSLPEREYRQCEDFARFFLKIAAEILQLDQEALDQYSFTLESLSKQPLVPGRDPITKKTRLCFNKQDTTLASMHAGKIDATVKVHLDLMHLCHLQRKTVLNVVPTA